jgi:protein-S-isoprenylcysteine O-methyltransferase Ste14
MTPEIRRQVLAWIRGAFLGLIGYAAIILLAAGRWDWLWGWVYIGLLAAALAAHPIVLVPINPALLADRSHGMRQPGARRWDVGIVMLASVFFFSAMIVGGLDARFGWSGAAPLWVHLAGVALFVVGWAIFLWAMACNPFFSEAVRIQEGHRVAERGPYRAVRHPGYAGACLGLVAQPLLIGSWPAAIPAILAVVAYVVRTALEDRTLQAELSGYAAYAQRTRYRLVPGVW